MDDKNTMGEPQSTTWFVSTDKSDRTATLTFFVPPATHSVVWEWDELTDLINELVLARKELEPCHE